MVNVEITIMNIAIRTRGGITDRIMLIMDEEAQETNITPIDMAKELLRLLVIASVEHNPSIMRKLALLIQNPS